MSLAIGVYMAITHNHALATIHTHVALPGWATMAVTGLVYLMLPACGGNRLAAARFWLHNIGLPAVDWNNQSRLRLPALARLTQRPISDPEGAVCEQRRSPAQKAGAL